MASLLLDLIDDNSWYPDRKKGDEDDFNLDLETLFNLISSFEGSNYGGVQGMEDLYKALSNEYSNDKDKMSKITLFLIKEAFIEMETLTQKEKIMKIMGIHTDLG